MKSTSRKTKSIISDKKVTTRSSATAMIKAWAAETSKRSTCSRLKVGAIVLDRKMRKVLGYGYNGNYSGGPNRCDSKEEGNCGCIHSEINALISCDKEKDMIMIVTHAPCLTCAKCIINAGVKTLYYTNEYRIKDGIRLLQNNITVIKI